MRGGSGSPLRGIAPDAGETPAFPGAEPDAGETPAFTGAEPNPKFWYPSRETPAMTVFFLDKGVLSTGYGWSWSEVEEAECLGLEGCRSGQDIRGGVLVALHSDAISGQGGEVGEQGLEAVDG